MLGIESSVHPSSPTPESKNIPVLSIRSHISTMDRQVSPPALKRRKLHVEEGKTGGGDGNVEMVLPRSIRVFSWNINGIDPYLPSSSPKITSYFSPSKPTTSNKDNPAPATNQTANLRAFLIRHKFPEALFLQELKIKPGDTKSLSALLSSLNTPLSAGDDALDYARTYQLDAVLPRDKYNARGFQRKLYGVATILRTDFARECVARVRDVEWDLEGRVSVVEMLPSPTCNDPGTKRLRKSYRPLALLNIYAVNGTAAPYRSPTTGLVIGTRHDHKRAFHSRLRDECLMLEARGFDVVIAGDLNVARGPLDGHPNLRVWPRVHCGNRRDFEGKFFGRGGVGGVRERGEDGYGDGNLGGDGVEGDENKGERCLDLVDVWRAMHGDERKYTYYPRTREWGSSCDRVDMALVSRRLWEAGRVKKTEILDTPQERGLSDHVPLWVEISVGDT